MSDVLKSTYGQKQLEDAKSYLETASDMLSRKELDAQLIINAISQLAQAQSQLEQLRGALMFVRYC